MFGKEIREPVLSNSKTFGSAYQMLQYKKKVRKKLKIHAQSLK